VYVFFIYLFLCFEDNGISINKEEAQNRERWRRLGSSMSNVPWEKHDKKGRRRRR